MGLVGRREEDQFDAIWPIDVTVVTRRNVEEVTAGNPCLGVCVHHSHHEIAAYAIASVVHRAGWRIAKQRLFVLLPCPARLEDGVHSRSAVAHLDDVDAPGLFHVQLVVWAVEAPNLNNRNHGRLLLLKDPTTSGFGRHGTGGLCLQWVESGHSGPACVNPSLDYTARSCPVNTRTVTRAKGREPVLENGSDPTPARPVRVRAPSREFLSKIALELFVVFIGVTAAFAVDDYREVRAQNERRHAVYLALDRELTQMAETHGPRFQREMTEQLDAWDRALARGEKPLPPTFRLAGAERPPTGTWDAAVATGSIELIDPALFYELARFYNRADSAGILYQRYSEGAQNDIWPYTADGPEAFWGANEKPRPEVLASVQRLRDFRQRQGELGREAQQLREKLRQTVGR
jgi:hypothetical protein